MNNIKNAVVLCGGNGTRFLPATKAVPKELLPIYDTPILELLIRELIDVKVENILIITNKNKNIIIDYFDNEYEYNSNKIQIFYTRQKCANGTGGATLLAEHFTNKEPFFLVFGDDIVFNKENIFAQLLQTFNKFNKSIISVGEVEKSQLSSYGIIQPKNICNNIVLVENIIEKPALELAPSNLAYFGTAILTNEIFDALKQIPFQKELKITDAYSLLIKKESLMAQIIEGVRLDVGTPLKYIESNVEYLKQIKLL